MYIKGEAKPCFFRASTSGGRYFSPSLRSRYRSRRPLIFIDVGTRAMNSANRGSRKGERASRLYALGARSGMVSDGPGRRDIESTYIIRSIGSSALGAAYKSR